MTRRAAVLMATLTMSVAAAGPRRRAGVGRSVASRLQEATGRLNRYVAEQKIAGAVAAVARKGPLGYLANPDSLRQRFNPAVQQAPVD
ncbi:MAG: hypothetical protein GEU82_05950 [Luteitalea sp.]|nr:hypothetical protein [Luteitalea sp.]